jgi:hypothetical protein
MVFNVFVSDIELLRGHVHTDNSSLRPNKSREKEAIATRAAISENRFNHQCRSKVKIETNHLERDSNSGKIQSKTRIVNEMEQRFRKSRGPEQVGRALRSGRCRRREQEKSKRKNLRLHGPASKIQNMCSFQLIWYS